MTQAEAADQIDQYIHDVLQKLRKGQRVPVPGVGVITPGRDSQLLRRSPMPPQLNEIVGEAIKQCLAEGIAVDLEGLGTFRRTEEGVSFERTTGPRVFIAYVVEDYPYALKLYHALSQAGFNPWLDRKKLLPGQNWRRCIEHAIDTCDFFIACFSIEISSETRPISLRSPLCVAIGPERMPLDDVFVVPVRLAECQIPKRIAWNMQYVDLFPEWEKDSIQLIARLADEWAIGSLGLLIELLLDGGGIFAVRLEGQIFGPGLAEFFLVPKLELGLT